MLLDCKGTNVIKQKQKQMFLDHVFTQQLNSSFKKTHEDSNNKIQNPKSKIQNPKSKIKKTTIIFYQQSKLSLIRKPKKKISTIQNQKIISVIYAIILKNYCKINCLYTATKSKISHFKKP